MCKEYFRRVGLKLQTFVGIIEIFIGTSLERSYSAIQVPPLMSSMLAIHPKFVSLGTCLFICRHLVFENMSLEKFAAYCPAENE